MKADNKRHKINIPAPRRLQSRALGSIIIVLLVYITCEMAQAQYLVGPTASASGGAGRAGAEASEAVLLNPAAIVHGPVFSSSLYYSNGNPAPDEADNFYGLSLVDNSDDIIMAGSLSYFRRERRLAQFGELKEEFWQVSGSQFVWNQLAVGASVLRLTQEVTSEVAPLGGNLGRKFTEWNGVLGVHYSPTDKMGFALVYYYFALPSSDLPEALRLPPQLSLGSYYIFNEVLGLKFDLSQPRWQNDSHELITQIGLDSKFNQFLVFRMGHSWDNWRKRRTGSLGVAFNGPQFRLDYSYQAYMGESGITVHSVDLRMPF